jgi:hypothetical protein
MTSNNLHDEIIARREGTYVTLVAAMVVLKFLVWVSLTLDRPCAEIYVYSSSQTSRRLSYGSDH